MRNVLHITKEEYTAIIKPYNGNLMVHIDEADIDISYVPESVSCKPASHFDLGIDRDDFESPAVETEPPKFFDAKAISEIVFHIGSLYGDDVLKVVSGFIFLVESGSDLSTLAAYLFGAAKRPSTTLYKDIYGTLVAIATNGDYDY